VVGRNRGSSARSSYSRASRIPNSSRGGRSDGAGSSEETIVQARAEQAKSLAEVKVKARAARERQQFLKEFQEKQLAIKKREKEFDSEQGKKEAERAVLTLENEQLQLLSESWLKDQQDIQETLAAAAGAEADAGAIVRETDSRSASPKLGLESVTSEEKISKFLRTSDPEECSMEDYIDPMIFNPSAFNVVRPKQTTITTHPEATTTTTLANNVYVSPPKLSFRVDSLWPHPLLKPATHSLKLSIM
jgi:hypothetical protein